MTHENLTTIQILDTLIFFESDEKLNPNGINTGKIDLLTEVKDRFQKSQEKIDSIISDYRLAKVTKAA